jgi:glycosyltransferase involved in cell wall biosynthesis
MAQRLNVSVVIAAYNYASGIGRAIQSVLNQTLRVDEIVVVDDGSYDGTAEVVESYGAPVICIRQANQGPSGAYNTGIQHAKNEWIAFLDQDDEWFPNHIENAYKTICKQPHIVWYYGGFERRSENGMLVYTSCVEDSFVHDGIIDNYFLAEAKAPITWTVSSMVVRKSVLHEAGLFNTELVRGNDLDLWFRIALRYPRIGWSKSPGCIYWMRKDSVTSNTPDSVPEFLRRIEITYTCSRNMPQGVTRESNYLIRRWVTYAIKEAIKKRDKENLATIAERYPRIMPTQWLVVIGLLQNDTLMEMVHIALAMRARLKQR